LNSDSQKTAKLVDYSKQSAQLAATAAAPVDNGSGITLNDEVFTKKHSMTIGDVSGETAVFNKVLLEGGFSSILLLLQEFCFQNFLSLKSDLNVIYFRVPQG